MPQDLIQRILPTLDSLYPPFRDLVFDLLARCRARGADYVALSGYRSAQEQLKLWQKGRNAAGAVVDPSKVVTRVKYGAHNAGAAIDVCRDSDLHRVGLQPSWNRSDYVILAEEARALGLEPGFDWTNFPDLGHVQLPLEKKNVTLTMLRGLDARGGLKSVHHFLDANGPWSA
jgi:peptidoglycan LD-endopeptidase CwlK